MQNLVVAAHSCTHHKIEKYQLLYQEYIKSQEVRYFQRGKPLGAEADAP